MVDAVEHAGFGGARALEEAAKCIRRFRKHPNKKNSRALETCIEDQLPKHRDLVFRQLNAMSEAITNEVI